MDLIIVLPDFQSATLREQGRSGEKREHVEQT